MRRVIKRRAISDVTDQEMFRLRKQTFKVRETTEETTCCKMRTLAILFPLLDFPVSVFNFSFRIVLEWGTLNVNGAREAKKEHVGLRQDG